MNKYVILAFIWFALSIYGLIFREAGNDLPPFPHFDKVCHFGLFFVQIWLCAKVFIANQKTIPYFGLLLFALLYAFGSEWAQGAFTETRQASWLDGIADMCGAFAALWLFQKRERSL